MTSSRATQLLESPVALELFWLLEWRGERALDEADLARRAFEARSTGSVFRGDYDEHVAFLRSKAPRYEQDAESFAARVASWWNPVDRNAQVWVGRSEAVPTAANMSIDFSPMHAEAPKPRRALWTSTMRLGLMTPWLYFGELRPHIRSAWTLAVSDDARVFEIDSPRAWWNLAASYAAKTPGYRYTPHQDRSPSFARIDPDWAKVAKDWDAVHLSMGGMLTAEDVVFNRDGVRTELRGWEMESTVWLRWVFTSVERLDVRG